MEARAVLGRGLRLRPGRVGRLRPRFRGGAAGGGVGWGSHAGREAGPAPKPRAGKGMEFVETREDVGEEGEGKRDESEPQEGGVGGKGRKENEWSEEEVAWTWGAPGRRRWEHLGVQESRGDGAREGLLACWRYRWARRRMDARSRGTREPPWSSQRFSRACPNGRARTRPGRELPAWLEERG